LLSIALSAGFQVPGAATAAAGSWAWALLPVLPVAGALLGSAVAAWRLSPERRAGFHALWSALVCLGVAALLTGLWAGGASQGSVRLTGVLGQGLVLAVSPAGLLFAAIAAWLWLLASLFARDYLAHGRAQGRFHFYFLLCLGGTVGVFLSGNFFSLFVFFELVSLGAYPLVAHEETAEAMSAGRLYLYMSIAGGLSLLLGTVYLESLVGTTSMAAAFDAGGRSTAWLVSMLLMLLGFAVKAGMFPVHIWLPRAHPVAPSPASALLSGVMIKTGAYGAFMVLRVFPPELAAVVGRAMVPLALATMFLGATLALFGVHAKRVLAYSSVSQIGYVLLGAAMAGIMGSSEAMGAGGFAMHVLAHALFKSTMFLLVGLIYQKTHDLNLEQVGPLGRRLPVTAAVFGLAVLGISGVPGFAGFGSKTLLHDGILILAHGEAGPAWRMVEWAFTCTSAMTFAYMAKLWYLLFLRPRPAADDVTRRELVETPWDKGLAVLAGLPLLLLGLAPAAALARLIAPALGAAGYGHYALHHLEEVAFFAREPLLAVVLPLTLGSLLLLVLGRAGFPQPLPGRGPSIEESVLMPAVRACAKAVRTIAAADDVVNELYLWCVRAGASAARLMSAFDQAVDRGVDQTARTGAHLAQAMTHLDQGIDEGIRHGARASGAVVRELTRADGLLGEGLDAVTEAGQRLQGGDGARPARPARSVLPSTANPMWTLRNLNIATMLMAALLGGLLLIFLFWPHWGPPSA